MIVILMFLLHVIFYGYSHYNELPAWHYLKFSRQSDQQPDGGNPTAVGYCFEVTTFPELDDNFYDSDWAGFTSVHTWPWPSCVNRAGLTMQSVFSYNPHNMKPVFDRKIIKLPHAAIYN